MLLALTNVLWPPLWNACPLAFALILRKDDAAGLAIATRMTAQVSTLDMAARNANDGISMVQTAEGASKEITNMLVRMKELAVQSASGTYSDTDRAALDLEFGALMSEIDRVAKNTTWNTNTVLNGGDATPDYSASVTSTALDIRLGSASTDKLTVTFKSWVPSVDIDAEQLCTSGDGTGMRMARTTTLQGTSAFGDAVLQWGTANTMMELESTSPQQTTRICNYATRQSHKGSNIGASELWCLY